MHSKALLKLVIFIFRSTLPLRHTVVKAALGEGVGRSGADATQLTPELVDGGAHGAHIAGAKSGANCVH